MVCMHHKRMEGGEPRKRRAARYTENFQNQIKLKRPRDAKFYEEKNV